MGGGEPVGVAVDGHAVVEAAERVEVVALAVVAGRLLPEPGVDLRGVVEELAAERIEVEV